MLSGQRLRGTCGKHEVLHGSSDEGQRGRHRPLKEMYISAADIRRNMTRISLNDPSASFQTYLQKEVGSKAIG